MSDEAALGEVPGDKQKLFDEHVGVFERFVEGDLLGALARFREHLSFPPPGTFSITAEHNDVGPPHLPETTTHVVDPSRPPERRAGERSRPRVQTG